MQKNFDFHFVFNFILSNIFLSNLELFQTYEVISGLLSFVNIYLIMFINNDD